MSIWDKQTNRGLTITMLETLENHARPQNKHRHVEGPSGLLTRNTHRRAAPRENNKSMINIKNNTMDDTPMSDFSKAALLSAVRQAAGSTPVRRNKMRSALDAKTAPDKARKLIAPTVKSFALMRQVSRLGMDDPVYTLVDRGVPNPANRIYDDMNVVDVPDDVLEQMSIASDPTAAFGNGIDVTVFEKSLGDLQPHFSMSQFSQTESSVPVVPQSPSPRSMATIGSNSYLSHIQQSQMPSSFRRSRPQEITISTEDTRMEDLGASMPSLDVISLDLEEAVFGGMVRKLARTDDSNTSRMNSSADDSMLAVRNSRRGCRRGKSSVSNSMMREAALAMEKDGNTNHQLIADALNNSIQDLRSEGLQVRHVPRRTKSNQEKYEAPDPVFPSNKSVNSASSKSRTLPSIASLFPEENEIFPSKIPLRRRVGVRVIQRKHSGDTDEALVGNPDLFVRSLVKAIQ